MNLNQWGLLIQILGFVFAGFFVAILKIVWIRALADNIRQILLRNIKPQDNGEAIRQNTDLGCLLVLFAFLLSETPKLLKAYREKKQISRVKYLLLYTKLIFIDYPLFLFFVNLFFLAEIINRVLTYFVKLLEGHQTATDSFIVVGTCLILIGLIIQFKATF